MSEILNSLTKHFKSLLEDIVIPNLFGSAPIIVTLGFIHIEEETSFPYWQYSFSSIDKEKLRNKNQSIGSLEELENTRIYLTEKKFDVFSIYHIYDKIISDVELSAGQSPLIAYDLSAYFKNVTNTKLDVIKNFIEKEKEMLALLIDHFQAESSFYFPLPIFHRNRERDIEELKGNIYLVYNTNTFEKGTEHISKVYSHLIMDLSKIYDIAYRNANSTKKIHPSLKKIAPLGL